MEALINIFVGFSILLKVRRLIFSLAYSARIRHCEWK